MEGIHPARIHTINNMYDLCEIVQSGQRRGRLYNATDLACKMDYPVRKVERLISDLRDFGVGVYYVPHSEGGFYRFDPYALQKLDRIAGIPPGPRDRFLSHGEKTRCGIVRSRLGAEQRRHLSTRRRKNGQATGNARPSHAA